MTITPARVAAAVGVVAGIGGAVAPIIANADWTSTAGIEAGALLIVGTVCNFLIGQRTHEARVDVLAARHAAHAAKPPHGWPPYFAGGSSTAATTGNITASGGILWNGPSNPPVPAVEGPPADPDEDTNVPAANQKLGKPELDDPDWKPRKR